MNVCRKLIIFLSHCGQTALLVGVFLSCGSIPRQTALMQRVPNLEVSAPELRLLVHELSNRFTAVVEQAADLIIDRATDRAVRQAALNWKMNATPQVHKAAFQSDPLGALVDLQTFSIQMRQYFTDGAGRDRYGQLQPIAIAAAAAIESDINEVARAIAPTVDGADGGGFADSIAREYPIADWHFARRSAVPAFASVTGQGGANTVQSVGSVAQNMDALMDRLSVYSEYMPKQLRWQAEWLLAQAMTREKGDSVMAGVVALSSIAAMVESIPEMITNEGYVMAEAVRNERAIAMSDIDRQRVATLAALRDERVALVTAFREERIAVLRALDLQRVAMLRDLETLSTNAVTLGVKESRDLIDHFFWRAAQLALVFLVLTALTIPLTLRWAMKKGGPIQRQRSHD